MLTKELGNLGEKMACEYLVKKGYNILGKNYRISFGEIDVIAKKRWNLFAQNEKAIHFVEVKTIMDGKGAFFPEERVDPRKQNKLRQMAEIWLEKNEFSQRHPYQIDVIGILANQETQENTLHYFPNVVAEA